MKTPLKKNTSDCKSIRTLLSFYTSTCIEQINNDQVELYEIISTKMTIQQLLAKHIDGIDIEPSVIRYYLKVLNKSVESVVIDNLIYSLITMENY